MSGREQQDDQGNLENLIDEILELSEEQDEVSVADIREAIGSRGFGPFLFIPSIIEISPIGGVPGMPTFIAIIVGLFAVQILFGREDLWLPGFIDRRSVKASRFGGLAKVRKPIRWIDKAVRPRLRWATRKPFLQLMALFTVALCLATPPLEIIPFAGMIPFATIALFGLALIARDGLMAVAGFLVSVIGIGFVLLR